MQKQLEETAESQPGLNPWVHPLLDFSICMGINPFESFFVWLQLGRSFYYLPPTEKKMCYY